MQFLLSASIVIAGPLFFPFASVTREICQSASSSSGSPTGSSSSGDSTVPVSGTGINAYLIAHNSYRAHHGALPLSWNNNLASKAQKWANQCIFEHFGGGLGPFGENLAAGPGNDYDIDAAVKSWTTESSQYNTKNPQPSHFTQMVWKSSTQVGCAVAGCDNIFDPSFGTARFFVCEYFPQGNVIGEFFHNVQV